MTLKAAGFQEDKAKAILPKMTDEMSEGERHRVALARVLIKESRIVKWMSLQGQWIRLPNLSGVFHS